LTYLITLKSFPVETDREETFTGVDHWFGPDIAYSELPVPTNSAVMDACEILGVMEEPTSAALGVISYMNRT
jgi:hypothetical protein